MHQPHRPSHKELTGKIRQAIAAIENGRFYCTSDTHVEEDLHELDLDSETELFDIVYDCLIIALEAPPKCFRQPSPPKSTKHELTKGLSMWAFEVQHPNYTAKLYFKFCLKPQPDGTHYCHIDCHESRP